MYIDKFGWTMRLLLGVAVSCAIFLGGLASQAAAAGFAGKRAILDEDIRHWTTKAAMIQTLDRIQNAGFNVYVPVVWHGRGTTWPSSLSQPDYVMAKPAVAGLNDPLRDLIAEAHSRGIQVHPWFTVALRDYKFAPKTAAIAAFSPPGTPDRAFDVHNPEFRSWIASIVAEVVKNYDVDGVNLDFVRAIDLCMSDYCAKQYEATYGRTFVLDAGLFKLKASLVPTMAQWQEQAVTQMVRTISQSIRALKPGITVSVDAIPGYAGIVQGQNSVAWANEGLIDVLMRMAYYRDIDATLTNKIRSQLKNPDKLTILMSNTEQAPDKTFISREGSWLAGTIRSIQQQWPNTGWAVYLYSMLNADQTDALKSLPPG